MPLPRLALFHGRLGDSRLAELEACAPAVSTWCWRGEVLRTNGGDEGPSLVQPLPDDVPDDVLADAAARAVGCRGAFEVWGAGDTVEACAAATAAVPAAHLRTRVDGPWRVESVVIGAKRSRHGGDLGARMRHFDHLFGALSGRPIQLRGPAHEVWLLEDRRTREGGGALPGDPPRFHLLLRLPTEVPDTRALVGRLDLRRRAFVSTTSLKPGRRGHGCGGDRGPPRCRGRAPPWALTAAERELPSSTAISPKMPRLSSSATVRPGPKEVSLVTAVSPSKMTYQASPTSPSPKTR